MFDALAATSPQSDTLADLDKADAEGKANIAKLRSPRDVKDPDMKTLWAKAKGMCCHPRCRAQGDLLLEATKAGDKNAVIGEMAHIVAYSDVGPRGDASVPEEQRNLYPNLILLCPNHHTTVDKQPNITPSALMKEWKSEWERMVDIAVKRTVQTVPYAELKLVADYLVQQTQRAEASAPEDLTLPTGIRTKLLKNQLTEEVELIIAVAQSRHRDVKHFVEHQEKLMATYPDLLRKGLAREFDRLTVLGFVGDDLYYALRDFAAGNTRSDLRLSAASVVISYFFVICEVFEP
ncbi:hypothetical protein BH09SUM1_BH09SUM1_01120 [soil metagenome]